MTPSRSRFPWTALAAAALLALQARGSLPDQVSTRWNFMLHSVSMPLASRRVAGSGASLDRHYDLFLAYVGVNTPAHANILLHLSPNPSRQASSAWYWHRANFLLAPRLVYPEGVPEASPSSRPDYLAVYGNDRLPPQIPEPRAFPGGFLGKIP